MKITYSHIEPEMRKTIEHETARYVAKLNRLLKRYPADSVVLHESLEKNPHQHEFSFSLNLILPTGTLHATGVGPDADVRASAKAAFAEIERQVKKHQEKLRKDYLWKRKRPRATIATPREAPSAD
jgi:ribosome-associated translation inhibitor RaiA